MDRTRVAGKAAIGEVLAMFVAATKAETFGPALWPHHNALRKLHDRAPIGGELCRAIAGWTFTPSSAGGYVVSDLPVVLWRLAAEGWLRREDGHYAVSVDLRERGERLLRTLSETDGEVVRACAHHWMRWSLIASKNAA